MENGLISRKYRVVGIPIGQHDDIQVQAQPEKRIVGGPFKYVVPVKESLAVLGKLDTPR